MAVKTLSRTRLLKMDPAVDGQLGKEEEGGGVSQKEERNMPITFIYSIQCCSNT